ncbi:helix-turn-helix domain-containing protein [Halopiger djelfimassiliensis]|uniref:helix-turn-helix domain-containing protein n=1 Tax=Halopiger djelfimassiliensis TaxID=1293047 RepID=UPI000677D3C9|nr:helix-turn-helix domain-containing protein [Halopiger djelfimassiliensis]
MHNIDGDALDSLGTSADELAAIGQLLNRPRLAHIWYTLYVEGNIVQEGDNPFLWDGLTVSELEEHLKVPQSTLYNDIEELVDIGAVEVASESQPKGYKATFLEAEGDIVEEIDEEDAIVNPPLIGLVGQAYVDEKVEEFLDEHGHDAVWEALLFYRAKGGSQAELGYTDLIPDIPDDQLESIVPSLRHILRQMSRDPVWGGDYSEVLESAQ